MTKGRLEAFSDGVIAIVITIMVLELKVPHSAQLEALRELWPKFFAYALSFIYVGIYWNNHHHLLHATTRVDGAVLWANLHLLFWLSLTPFVTAWMGENHAAPVPVAIYGVDLLLAAIAYYILVQAIIRAEGPHSRVAAAVGSDFKGKISAVLYAVAVPASFIERWAAIGIYVLVAMMWLVPDRRMVRGGAA
ncbi:MAG TPA: TMEM175 family protein [Polyangia bacterium]|nr:TMEM175 family protein [Polyangia bacterium]